MPNVAFVYIDGYNWYHAIFRHHPEWKWLNVQRLFETLRPHDDVRCVKFFTAIVNDERTGDPARERHLRFVRALKTLPKVQVILGKFQDREVTCRAQCGQKYIVPEEKKTDVNIAVHILDDAFNDRFDRIVLVSGDSDAQPPIEWLRRVKPAKRITVYIPALPTDRIKRRLDRYHQLGVECSFLPLDVMASHQLPGVVRDGEGKVICRPQEWK